MYPNVGKALKIKPSVCYISCIHFSGKWNYLRNHQSHQPVDWHTVSMCYA